MKPNYNSFDGSIISTLSLAILPLDNSTNKMPINKISVFINEIKKDGILNSSGYYLFFDLNNNKSYTLKIESYSNVYLDVEIVIDLQQLNQNPDFQKNPVITIKLHPSSSYHFPSNTTMIRGIIKSQFIGVEKIPVENAIVRILEKNLSYNTSKNGEYIFYFTNLRPNDIVEELLPDGSKKKFIKMNGNSSLFTLRVEHPLYNLFQENNHKVELGKTTVINVKMIPT